MIRTILFGILALIGLGLLLFNSEVLMATGMVIIILGFIIFLTSRNAEDLAKWVFVLIFLIIFGLITLFVFNAASPSITDTQSALLAKGWALGVGVFVSLVATVVLFLLVVYISAIYVMALPHTEGATFWNALVYTISLVTNSHRAWLLVQDGEVSTLKQKGHLAEFGGPGKLIVSPGSAVITERGGHITGAYGAGVTKLHKKESVRVAFDLKPQMATHNLENVITADQIPLKITLAVGYRIKPAENPNAPGVLKDNVDGYTVDAETLYKAAFNNGKFGWHGFGANVAVNQLRDQIMRYRLDDLFEKGATATVNDRKIAKIEEEIKANINSFAANNGVLITVVDIREITPPENILKVRAKGMEEHVKNEAANELLDAVLATIENNTGLRGERQLEMAQEIITTLKLTETKGAKVIRT